MLVEEIQNKNELKQERDKMCGHSTSLLRWSGIVGLMLVLCLVTSTQIFQIASDKLFTNVCECTSELKAPNHLN